MAKYVAENVVKNMIKADKPIKGSTVAIFGITFKENCPDVRNTKVIDVIEELNEYGINVKVVDPVADEEDLLHTYRISLSKEEEIKEVDAVIFAVNHDEFKEIKLEDVQKLYNNIRNGIVRTDDEVAAALDDPNSSKNVLIDVKGMFDRKEAEALNYLYCRL